MENKSKIINRNASSSAFGWDFQINSAILLMIDNIEDVSYIKVEGKHEDIELYLNNGKTIYAQAKSFVNPYDDKNISTKLSKGLETLNDTASKNKNVEKLIYITNHSNPFNDARIIQSFYGYTRRSYDDLPDIAKEYIDKIINDKKYTNINKSLFYIYVFPFDGSDLKNRYKLIREEVRNFLDGLKVEGISLNDLLGIWQNDCFQNSTINNENIKLKKEDFIWPIIILSLDKYIEIEDLDEGILQEVNDRYKSLINRFENRFSLITKVLFDFDTFKEGNSHKEKIDLFINKKWNEYSKDVFTDDIYNHEVKEYVLKSIIKKILDKRFIIDKIKKGVGIN